MKKNKLIFGLVAAVIVLAGIIAGATIHERNTYEAVYTENNTGIDVYAIEPMAIE